MGSDSRSVQVGAGYGFHGLLYGCDNRWQIDIESLWLLLTKGL
jgi:hypothetical protein